MAINIPPFNVQFLDPNGHVSHIWHRYFIEIQREVNSLINTETISYSGSSGGGDSASIIEAIAIKSIVDGVSSVKIVEDVIKEIFQSVSSRQASGNSGGVQFNTQGYLDADSYFYWDKINKKLHIGATQDMSISHDSTNAIIKTNEEAASDLLIECGTHKTLELKTVVYNDIYFEIAPKTVGTGKPTLVIFDGNIKQWQMGVNDITELQPIEPMHKWEEGSELEVHVHWISNGLDLTDRGVKWEIDYTWANELSQGGQTAFPAVTTISMETQIPANTPDKTNLRTSVFKFTPSGGKINLNILMSLKRIASVTDPTPSNDPWVLIVGIHERDNTIGSRQVNNK